VGSEEVERESRPWYSQVVYALSTAKLSTGKVMRGRLWLVWVPSRLLGVSGCRRQEGVWGDILVLEET